MYKYDVKVKIRSRRTDRRLMTVVISGEEGKFKEGEGNRGEELLYLICIIMD